MRFLEHLKIRERMSLGFGILIGMIVLLCILSFQAEYKIDRDVTEVARMVYDKTNSSVNVNVTANNILQQKINTIMETNRQIVITLLIFCIASVVIGLFLSYSITRSITVPIEQSVKAAKALAKGNLTIEVPTNRKDEFGEEMAAVREMVHMWRSVIGNLKTAAASISSAGRQLSSGAEQISQGSGNQADRASQVAAASQQMSQTVLDIARNANNIASSAADTAQVALNGKEVVGQSMKEVREIAQTVDESAGSIRSLGERSLQIGRIVDVINDIADQTNLLALNAAIEAARAGEQGRGFAVVADEVRKLAERTANSTSEIGGMIKAIQQDVDKAVATMNKVTKKVEAGVGLSGKAGDSLQAIVGSVDELLSMVQQIASATDQMGATSEEINRDIEKIASVSKEVSITSEKTAQASDDLTALSQDLEKMVGQFKI